MVQFELIDAKSLISILFIVYINNLIGAFNYFLIQLFDSKSIINYYAT